MGVLFLFFFLLLFAGDYFITIISMWWRLMADSDTEASLSCVNKTGCMKGGEKVFPQDQGKIGKRLASLQYVALAEVYGCLSL